MEDNNITETTSKTKNNNTKNNNTKNNTQNNNTQNSDIKNINIKNNNTENNPSATAERFDLEAALARLEDIAGILEKQDTPLRDALDVYSEGVKLIKECRDNLCDVEKEMIVLSKEGENDI